MCMCVFRSPGNRLLFHGYAGLIIQMPGPGKWQRKFRFPKFPFSRWTCRGPFSSVSTLLIARVGAFFSIFRDLQSPLSGEKKCEHFSSPEKKEHLVGARESPPRHPEAPEGYQRLTLGQRWVNVRSTLGNFPSHLGPILADFAGSVDFKWR